MTIGVLVTICGIIALFSSMATSIASAAFIGALMVVVGGLEIVTAFRVRHEGPWLMFLMAGLLSFVVGAFFLVRPAAGAASLGLLIACYMFAGGLFRGITAIVDRCRHWGWDFAYGVVTVLLGAYLAVAWPNFSLVVLGTVVGLEIIMSGVALIAASLLLREVTHREPHPVH
jgi:uncharacterized membrane protein HdeD (DUF308 family)